MGYENKKSGNHKRIGITVRTMGPIVLIVLFMLFSTVFSVNKVEVLVKEVTNLQEETIIVKNLAETIRYEVVSTAEIFTDISATGEKEGFADAEESKANFYAAIEELKKTDPLYASDWDDKKRQYDEFYELCTEMANTYIESGTEAGNLVMEKVHVLKKLIQHVK